MMKRIRRLFCAAAAAILICTNTVWADEVIVEPSPLSSDGQQTASSASATAQGPGGDTTETISADGPGGETVDAELIALGPGAFLSDSSAAAETGSLTTTDSQTTDETGTTGQSLEGTVFAGSSTVAQPEVAAEGAVLLNCNTGQILYEKNSSTQFYPASITKVMTALLTAENCSLDDVVTFSETATTNLESGAVTINLTAGDQLTVEQCLYALLLKSANEVANGLAEHISGSVSAFADLMNERAAQLGCTGTHFANPNGLNDSTHVTTPYDMALIARAAYANSTVAAISSTLSYQLPATINNSSGVTVSMGHKMLYPTDSRYYEGIVGGKTGYTSKAGNTLVTCVERDGLRLIAVVMKASGTHYTDTKAMLDYGYALAENGEI